MSRKPSILLMDEDADVLEQLQTVLQRAGYHVLVAVDGHAALRLAKTARPSLIVSDLLLAGLDGYEVWKLLRTDEELPRIPILVTSALTIPSNNEAWRPTPGADWQILNYDAVLPKPVDLPRFVRVVKKLLNPDEAEAIPAGPSTIVAGEDLALQETLTTLLRDQDFGVNTLASFDEALQLTKSIPPAALILDYHRPNDLVKKIVLQAHSFAPNTVIMLIVNPDQDIDPALQAQCHGFLTLPLHPTYTIAGLKHTLDLYGMRRRTAALSSNLLSANRGLLDSQQALQAQNKELQLVNAKLQGADDPKESFAGIMVHDLKSPLGSILGTLNFLVTDPDLNISPINGNLLNGSIAAGHQMLRLIETLLEGQRLESGSFEVYTEPFDLSTIVDIALEQILPFLTLHNLELTRNIANDLPLAFADANVTQRIVQNLLDNAIKYAPGNSAIIIEAMVDKNMIKVSLTDEGPAIPADQKLYVFDRFTLLKKSGHAPARSGFGLALNYCHLAAQAQGGSIWVESDGKTGAAFVFTLPIFTD